MYEIEPGLVLFPGSTLGQFFLGGGGSGERRIAN